MYDPCPTTISSGHGAEGCVTAQGSMPMSFGAPAVDHTLSELAAMLKRRPALSSHTLEILSPPALRDNEKWQ